MNKRPPTSHLLYQTTPVWVVESLTPAQRWDRKRMSLDHQPRLGINHHYKPMENSSFWLESFWQHCLFWDFNRLYWRWHHQCWYCVFVIGWHYGYFWGDHEETNTSVSTFTSYSKTVSDYLLFYCKTAIVFAICKEEHKWPNKPILTSMDNGCYMLF
jgi:hypothetical protein